MINNELVKTGNFLIGKTTNYHLWGGSKVYSYHIYLDIELRLNKGINYKTLIEQEFLELSISGVITHFRSYYKDNWCEGQIDDTLLELKKKEGLKLNITKDDFNIIMDAWKKYHLNDTIPGTINQYKVVEEWRRENNITGWAYNEECEYLKSIGLFEDSGIKWGWGWYFKPIPVEILKKLKDIIINYSNDMYYEHNLKILEKWNKEKSYLFKGV